MEAIAPPPRRAGDRLGVCAPAGPCPAEALRAGLARVEGPLRLGAVAQRLLDGGGPPGFLAGSDDERADELNALLRDPDVRAIAMARGGHGVTRILPRLEAAALRADPKPIIGFSDGTALLAWALHAGVQPLHGPVIVQLANLPDLDVASWHAALAGRPAALAGLERADDVRLIEGPLVGGNLTVLAQLCGTPWAMPTAGAILLLEDVGERPYAIDRDLTQLGNAGALDGVRAVVLGDLTRCTEPPLAPGGTDDPAPARDVVRAALATRGIALTLGAAIGHGDRNRTVPFGRPARLDRARGTIEFSSVDVS